MRRSFHRSAAFDYAGWVNVHAPAGGACNGTERAAARYTSEGDRRYAPSVAHGVQSRDDLSPGRPTMPLVGPCNADDADLKRFELQEQQAFSQVTT